MPLKRTAAAMLLLAALALTGCGTGGSPESDSNAGSSSSYLYERSITLTDGRTVTCVIQSVANRGGVSCDWDRAR